MRADDVDAAERERFAAWLAASPLHAEAWDTVQALFADLEAPAKAVRRQTAAPLTAKRPRRWRTASMAAALAACAVLITTLPQSTLLQNLQISHRHRRTAPSHVDRRFPAAVEYRQRGRHRNDRH
ncbi:FecR/PupR family sigma factor regulator [Methylomonas sp. BW4-1]|uniref:FecR/PupR family sigma factor regulator n=1 Tax=Methylomonas sp. BW4-1 TaxID=3376685 RepID=UPI0040420949